LLRLNVPRRPEAESLALVIGEQKNRFAVTVDEVIRQQQVVMKQVGREIRNQTGFLGTAILGDGQPALILDLHDLVKRAVRPAMKSNAGPLPTEAA
jgi:two-component system chemotaxis sensor kinase CheA